MLKDDSKFYLFNEAVVTHIERSFPYYFGDGKKDFRFCGFMYDYGFDLVQSEHFINIDFGLKHQIRFFLPYFYSFFPYYLKSSSLLFWREFKYLLEKSLPGLDRSKFLSENLYFRSTFPLNFFNFSINLNTGFHNDIYSDISKDMWRKKNLVHKLSYDVLLDIDNHISLDLSGGWFDFYLKPGYLTTHFLGLGLTDLSFVSEFQSGRSFFVRAYDNVKSRPCLPYFVKLAKKFAKAELLKSELHFYKSFFLDKLFDLKFMINFLNILLLYFYKSILSRLSFMFFCKSKNLFFLLRKFNRSIYFFCFNFFKGLFFKYFFRFKNSFLNFILKQKTFFVLIFLIFFKKFNNIFLLRSNNIGNKFIFSDIAVANKKLLLNNVISNIVLNRHKPFYFNFFRLYFLTDFVYFNRNLFYLRFILIFLTSFFN